MYYLLQRAGSKDFASAQRQRRLPKNLTDISVAKLLGRRLNDTLLGRTLATKQEMPAQLLRLGTGNYIATTKLLKDDSDQVTGSVLYTVGVNGQRAEDDLRVSQRFTQELAKKLGYRSTEWIRHITHEHAQQLMRCLCATRPGVPNPDYCPYQYQCGFHPRHGWLSLDRRDYHRVAIDLAVELRLLQLESEQPLPEEVTSKLVPGQTVDLSLGGTQVSSPVQLPLNCTVQVSIIDGSQRLVCEGEVVWQRRCDQSQWLNGIRFYSLTSQNYAAIIRLVNEQQLKDRPRSIRRMPLSFNDPVVESYVGTLKRLLVAKHEAVFRHCLDTAAIAKELGIALGLSDRQLQILYQAAQLHDLGKLEIERGLLEKRGPLSAEEQRRIRMHTVYGADLVKSIPAIKFLASIIRHHHEHFDGSGYPDQLRGKRTPLLSRIISVADVVDEVSRPQTYERELLTREEVIELLQAESGKKFDPEIAEKCIELIKAGKVLN